MTGYGGSVPDDTIVVTRRVEANGGALRYEFPVAGLASWLCLKADAIMRRDKPKDAYDVVWLLDALGPRAAAEQVVNSPLLHSDRASEVVDQLRRLVQDQFKGAGSIGPGQYATFLDADPGVTERRHATGTLSAFARAIATTGISLDG